MFSDHLPAKLNSLTSASLYASIIWLTLIILMILVLFFLKPLKNIFTQNSVSQVNNQKSGENPKGFKSD